MPQGLNAALSQLRNDTGRDYTLAYNRNFTSCWVRLDNRTISPALPIARLAQWLAAYGRTEGEKNGHS